MFGDKAVSAMYRFVKSSLDAADESKVPIYKYERPKKLASKEYVVVNHLPFVNNGSVGEGIVNVNIHTTQTTSGEPNVKRLIVLASAILSQMNDDTYLDGAYFEYYCDSRPTHDNDDTYYMNIKFNVTFNNLRN